MSKRVSRGFERLRKVAKGHETSRNLWQPLATSGNLNAEILTIGDELLKGSTLNTNARFLGEELTQLGFKVTGQSACPDSIPAISKKLSEALVRSEVMILSGGLGPTPDDVTRDAVSDFFRVPLVFSKSQFALIRRYYERRSRKKVPEIVRREAQFPANAVPLLNRFGVALGFFIRSGRRLLIALPGVPSELERMFETSVCPLLLKSFPDLKKGARLLVKMVGISEPEVMRLLGRDFFNRPFEFGIYPKAGEVAIRLQADTRKTLQILEGKIKKRLRPFIYTFQERSLAEVCGKHLTRRKKTLAVVESCTGGLLTSELTKLPGASRFLVGSVVAYHDRIKSQTLGVPQAILKKEGAVSEKTAAALAQGIREKFSTSYGMGVTGIAGPSGGSKKKPVGLVYIALASSQSMKVWKEVFVGERQPIQKRAVVRALEYLWKTIR